MMADHPNASEAAPRPKAAPDFKLYFIFCAPLLFTFALLLFLHLFFLRRRRVDWSSLITRTSLEDISEVSGSDVGLKKELREMLPIVVYKESFSVTDTQCSVCLGDYKAEDRLQQVPGCGHSFHMECIDHWLSLHSTCPLCRFSVGSASRTPTTAPDGHTDAIQGSSLSHNGDETSTFETPHACGEACIH